LAADSTKKVASDYGVLIEDRGIALPWSLRDRSGRRTSLQSRARSERGSFAEETLRVIQALQTGGLCQAEWKPGQKTLN
jgi:alkyl hydroperoxide reductase subunit AhpC